jgi:hypothetical protein
MMYSGNRTDVKNIVQWLRGVDESKWEAQTRLLFEIIAVLREMSDPIIRRDKPDLLPPRAVGINAAMPYLRGMLAAMFGHNRQDALEYGQAALALLPVE